MSTATLKRLTRTELFKLRTTNIWVLFFAASVITSVINLIVNIFNAHSLLKPFNDYVTLRTHGHYQGVAVPADLKARMLGDWTAGHSAVTQASAIYTSGQLIGLLLACLLGIVVVTSEFQQLTATSTFLTTPRRGDVIRGKLVAAVILGAAAWVISSVICVVAGAVFLHFEGHGAQLSHGIVLRSLILNLVAYLLWAVVGVGFGALLRNQLVATISATVVYLVGAGAASAIFDLLNTYVIKQNWILSVQTIVPSVASTVMISATKPFDQSPASWVGALVLIGYAVLFGTWGLRKLNRTDIG
jgi:ABC-2 type transport system permease protein